MLQLDARSQRETVRAIIDALKDPFSDPRDSMPKAALKADVPRMTDLTIGRIVEGVVTNITTFGIFVDIGMKQTGFVHKTEVSNNAADTPASVANVGDVLRARVTSLDFQRDRIVLSLRNVPAEGESVPATEEVHHATEGQEARQTTEAHQHATEQQTSANNTNVIPDLNEPISANESNGTPVNDEPREESHGDEVEHDENAEMMEGQEYTEMTDGAEHEEMTEAAEYEESGAEHALEGDAYDDAPHEEPHEEHEGEEEYAHDMQHDEQDEEHLSTAYDAEDATDAADTFEE